MKDNRPKWTGRQTYETDLVNPRITYESFLFYRSLSKELKKSLAHAKGILLDIGAGKAPYRRLFEPRVKKYITLDFFDNKEKPDIIAPATRIPLKKGTVDTVLCTQVLEHLPDPIKAVSEMHRVLKRGGWCIASTHMAMVLHGEPHDYFRFTKYALKDVVFKRFSEVRVIENGGSIYCLGQFFAWAFNEQLPAVLSKPLILLLNVFVPMLDRMFFSTVLTNNYLILAKK